MSTDANFFIGWYLKGKKRNIKSNDHEYVCSRADDHEVDETANYCSVCGSKIAERGSLSPRTLNIYAVPEEHGDLEDRFFEPEHLAKKGEVILVSNWSAGNYLSEFESNEIVNLFPTTRDEQYDSFIKEHAEDIELLQKYVYDDVQVLYGVWVYYS